MGVGFWVEALRRAALVPCILLRNIPPRAKPSALISRRAVSRNRRPPGSVPILNQRAGDSPVLALPLHSKSPPTYLDRRNGRRPRPRSDCAFPARRLEALSLHRQAKAQTETLAFGPSVRRAHGFGAS